MVSGKLTNLYKTCALAEEILNEHSQDILFGVPYVIEVRPANAQHRHECQYVCACCLPTKEIDYSQLVEHMLTKNHVLNAMKKTLPADYEKFKDAEVGYKDNVMSTDLINFCREFISKHGRGFLATATEQNLNDRISLIQSVDLYTYSYFCQQQKSKTKSRKKNFIGIKCRPQCSSKSTTAFHYFKELNSSIRRPKINIALKSFQINLDEIETYHNEFVSLESIQDNIKHTIIKKSPKEELPDKLWEHIIWIPQYEYRAPLTKSLVGRRFSKLQTWNKQFNCDVEICASVSIDYILPNVDGTMKEFVDYKVGVCMKPNHPNHTTEYLAFLVEENLKSTIQTWSGKDYKDIHIEHTRIDQKSNIKRRDMEATILGKCAEQITEFRSDIRRHPDFKNELRKYAKKVTPRKTKPVTDLKLMKKFAWRFQMNIQKQYQLECRNILAKMYPLDTKENNNEQRVERKRNRHNNNESLKKSRNSSSLDPQLPSNSESWPLTSRLVDTRPRKRPKTGATFCPLPPEQETQYNLNTSTIPSNINPGVFKRCPPASNLGSSRNLRGRFPSNSNFSIPRGYPLNSNFNLRIRPSTSNFNEPRGFASNFNEPRNFASNFNEPRGFASNFNEPRSFASNFNEPRGFTSNFNEPRGFASNFNEPRGFASNFNEPSNFSGPTNSNFNVNMRGNDVNYDHAKNAAFNFLNSDLAYM